MSRVCNIFLLVIVSFCAISCVEQHIMDPRERTIMVNCIITNDSVQTVNLAYTSYVSESYYPKVQEADVKIFFKLDTTVVIDGLPVKIDTSGVYEFTKKEDGVWQAEFFPMEGTRYSLEITVPGYETVTAKTKYPAFIYMENTLSYITFRNVEYNIRTNIKSVLWAMGYDYNPNTFKHEIADYIFTNHLYVDNFNNIDIKNYDIKEFQWPDEIEHGKLPEGYLEKLYLDGTFLFLWGVDSCYAGRVGINYSDYEIDYYITAWRKVDTTHIFHDRYLRIDHPAGSKDVVRYTYKAHNIPEIQIERLRSFQIAVNFAPYKKHVSHPLSYILFQSVSEDLDKYYNSLILYSTSSGPSDISSIWNMEPKIHNNITNGYGIFGASYNVKARWGISQHYYESYIASQNADSAK